MTVPAYGIEGKGETVKESVNKKSTSDFDQMKKDGIIRALVPYSKTFYFLDGGTQRGATYEMLKLFEDHLNKKFDTKNVKIHVLIIPTPRDRLIPALAEGLGDIAAGNLTITEERLKTVNFSDPINKDVDEILVTGPSAPKIASKADLSNQKIYVRKSRSY